MPELPFDIQKFRGNVEKLLKEKTSIVVAVSEGIRTPEGKYVCELARDVSFVDAFGHKQLSGTASYLASFVAGELGCKTRAIEFSLLQRCGAHLASQTDIDESCAAGKAAVEAAVAGETDKMVGFECTRENGVYSCNTKLFNLSEVANFEKKVPVEWINEAGNGVTQDFIDYALPLIQGENHRVLENGLPRFAHLKKVLACDK